MSWRWLSCTFALLITSFSPPASAQENLGLRVPEGFEVSLFAGDELAHDIFSMTIDAQGRVVVAGPGYVKRLEDADGDGRADRAVLFSPIPKSGAHGMLFDGPDLICTGDDSLMRLRDADGDGVADKAPEIWTRLRHPEHGANGVVRGPDGWYYVICGNDAGVSDRHASLPTSPVKQPRCGAVVRFSPDGKQSEVVAHGFRNPYDCDFTAAGNLFTVDADGERDHYLPWYAPTRLFDIAQGMEHGWLLQGWQRSWNRPASFFDAVERAVEIGRGSPTGLIVYRHRQFPGQYRGRVFSACWTLGRVYAIALQPTGASYRGQIEVFLQTTGDVGFAPVDLVVGPEGDLFVAVGGRGTRGSVFRVRYPGGVAAADTPPTDELTRVLDADQPLASWSRARWVPLAKSLGSEAFAKVIADASQSQQRQVRAVEVLTELYGGLGNELARRAIALHKPELSARVAWALSRARALMGGPDAEGQAILAELTYDVDARVQRAAWEALAALASFDPTDRARSPNWCAAAASPIRRVRAAMIAATRGPGRESFRRTIDAQTPSDRDSLARVELARLWISGPPLPADSTRLRETIQTCLRAVSCGSPDIPIEAVRLLQIALGDLRVQPGQPEVYSGYTGNATEAVDASLRNEIVRSLAPSFPTGGAELDRELARLFAMLSAEHEGLLEAVVSRFTPDSPVLDDIHYLIVLSRLGGERTPAVTKRTAHALCELHRKLIAGKMYPDRNWPLRVGEAFEQLCRRDAALSSAVAEDKSFGLPEHSLFAAAMQGDAQQRAARALLRAADAADNGAHGNRADEGSRWTPELVRVFAVLPDGEILPRLRRQWDEPGLRDTIVAALARHPQAEDRARFVEALASMQADVISRAAGALSSLDAAAEPAEIGAAVAALRRCCAVRDRRDVRAALAGLLARWSGKQIDVAETGDADLLAAYRPWFAWFETAHPAEAARWKGHGTADAKAWAARLAKIDWTTADVKRGRTVFESVTCNRCHTGGGRLGPELTGAAARFARDDLFAAIVDPSRDVSPAYQTTAVTTRSGQAYNGVLVYDSADGLLLQTGPDTTVRITGDDIATQQASRQSLMPTGLLDRASDQDLADLYAYLKTLSAK
jgi:putative membrane-bound dehydrogenase-like protein